LTTDKQKEFQRDANNDKMPREVEARVKKLRHKLQETRRLLLQRLDDLDAEAEQLTTEKTG
jgi:hypothetical protein